MKNQHLPKLLRALANSERAREDRHDVILNAAADEIETLRSEVKWLASHNPALRILEH